MKEGAWLNGPTGAWAWITEHASWIRDPVNARGLGMPEAAIQRLAAMPWDFNGPGRMAILLEAMAQGFIRFRGHGSVVTFEFTVPLAEAMQASRPFMDQIGLGPLTGVRFNNLKTGAQWGGTYQEFVLSGLGEGRPATAEPPAPSGPSDVQNRCTPPAGPQPMEAAGTPGGTP